VATLHPKVPIILGINDSTPYVVPVFVLNEMQPLKIAHAPFFLQRNSHPANRQTILNPGGYFETPITAGRYRYFAPRF
jgi:hypothetical protein